MASATFAVNGVDITPGADEGSIRSSRSVSGIAGLLRAPRAGHAAAAPPSSVMNSRRFTDHLVGVPQERLRNGEADQGAGNRVASVDDLICSHLYCCRYCQTECFQGLLVNHKTEAGRLLEWEIGGARSS